MENFEIKAIKYLSHNGKNMISAKIYEPKGEIKGIVQISHGMCEYIDRYADFMAYMVNHGYLIAGNDHLGHGDSSDSEMYGYFAEKQGYVTLVDDLHSLTLYLKRNYGYEIPYFLLGHSMGSFIARLYLSKYVYELDGAIICGTAGKNVMTNFGILASKLVMIFKGSLYRSPLLDKMAFGNFNKKVNNPRTSKDWLSQDEEIVDKYLNDSKCMFTFTAAGFKDLMSLATLTNQKSWFKELDKELPIYLIAGEDDPVGNYGKGVKKVYSQLLKYGQKDTEIKLYPKGRHEILNEINKEEVYQDVLNWINRRVEE